mmetsp:Transcript_501/g.736  ORF Transcript_501/g.736 Transcript_501/m.736 type:complete len:182 (-) Transcript_501:175-720(-)|eukprot:CAMPEP_0113936452 /NCGR_PEP_ID=MMETSP1339-20121228/3363_1 /TAXON_ID=94617 /ORGANISM="Fibrocapsa japonica" /LENGTH=181 /DNA_ID=CAMNT_0000938933 /DNA_START=46 /DNA_END=591 /DNA_ORIENTATION=- /assembly_acc=CAM_ASM_000762
MNSIHSGTSHYIIPKRIVLFGIVIGVGMMFGMYLSEHLRAARMAKILEKKNMAVKVKNDELSEEKVEYEDIVNQLEAHMEEWTEDGGIPADFLDKHKAFHEKASNLLGQMHSVHALLMEKEYELYDKEALLEYQEEELMDSEDFEDQMISYINEMGKKMEDIGEQLPDGLEDEVWYGKKWN